MKGSMKKTSSDSSLENYFKAFSTQAIIMELKQILKIGRNPLSRKRLNKEDIAEIRQVIKDLV